MVKILLNREVFQMKSNTQNTKIEAVTEKTLVVGIDVGSEFHYARAFDWRGIEYGSSTPRSPLSSATRNRDSQSLRHGSFIYRQSMIRIA